MEDSRPPERSAAQGRSAITLAAVGDIMLGDHPLCVGFGAYSRFRSRPPLYPLQNVRDELANADILFGNLECPLSEPEGGTHDWTSLQMRGHPKHAEALAEARFSVLSLANNHSMHHGPAPFMETLRLLDQHGIATCGVSVDNHRVGIPRIVDAAGITVAFLGYSLRPRQHFNFPPLYTEGDGNAIVGDVTDAAKRADVVVVSLHWGEEFLQRPSPAEIRMAHAIIEAGAHVIIGHHPHVLRGIEAYRHGIIVYSLGNFVSDMLWDEPLRESAIFSCRVAKSGVDRPALTPVRIDDECRPEALSGSKATAVSSKIAELSEELTTGGLSSFDAQSRVYQFAAEAALRHHRKRSYGYFLRNFHRSPSRVLAQQFVTRAGRHLAALTARV